MTYWFYFLLLLFLGGSSLTALVIYWHRTNHLRLTNITLLALALFLMLMAAEFYFKVFFAQPDAFGTFARQNWYARYYSGTFNSLNYRDKEWTADMVQGKIKVMVVGDSFVEGVGIEYPQDRFPDKLAQKLGQDYVVFNLGKQGASTTQEIEAIVNYPYSPDILILSYFVNDIEGVAWQFNLYEPPKVSSPPLARHSYALNFVYWRLARLFGWHHLEDRWNWWLSLYDDPRVWWQHQQELLALYEGAKSQQIPLIVVVFSAMNALDQSRPVAQRVVNLFEEKGVPVLDVTNLIQDIPTSQLVASPVDSHPSELVHMLVANALYDLLVDHGLISAGATP